MIPFPPFEPDKSRYDANSTDNVVNCLPVAGGWGPLPALVPTSDALPATCKGAFYVRNKNGEFIIFAGTASGLYRYNTATLDWDAVSGSSAPYSVATEDRWSFCVYGGYLLACNINDPVQRFDIELGTTFEDLPGSPPQAKYMCVAGDFLVLGYINDGTAYPMQVRWSGVNDPTHWTVGLKGSDFQNMPDGDEVTGFLGGPRGATVFQRNRIRQMVVTGDVDFAFSFDVVNPRRGVIAPLSCAIIGPNQFVYLSLDGFMMNAEGAAIGAERVDKWFFDTIDKTLVYEIRAVPDPYNKVVWWQATKVDATKFLIGYHWQLDRWCLAESNISEMFDMITPAISIDGMDTYFATIDDASAVAFDSRQFAGGVAAFAAFDTSNRLGFYTGTPQAATLDTAVIQHVPHGRSFVDETEVYTDAATYTLAISATAKYSDAASFGSAVSPHSRTGLCHSRASGRLHQYRLAIPAGTTWTHVHGIEPNPQPDGEA